MTKKGTVTPRLEFDTEFLNGFCEVTKKRRQYRTTESSPICMGSWSVPNDCFPTRLKVIVNISVSYMSELKHSILCFNLYYNWNSSNGYQHSNRYREELVQFRVHYCLKYWGVIYDFLILKHFQLKV